MSKRFLYSILAMATTISLTGATVTYSHAASTTNTNSNTISVVKDNASDKDTATNEAVPLATTASTASITSATTTVPTTTKATTSTDSTSAAMTGNTNGTTLSPLLQSYYTKSNTIQAVSKANQPDNEPATVKATASDSVIQNAARYVFKDVPANYWAADSISYMTRQQLISGYSDNTFRPEKPLTREEAASLFSKLIGDQPSVLLSSTFNDITSDRWSAAAIESVARKNIISGYGDNTYRPEKYMSRQEFAVVADNYIHYLGYITDDPTVLDGIHFSDQKFIASWAQDAVRELAVLGFISYNPHDLFNPEKYVTRAEATEITYRMVYSKQAVALHEAILHRQSEEAALTLIKRTFGDKYDFRQNGAMYWKDDLLYIAMTHATDAQKLGAAMAFSHDRDALKAVRVSTGAMSEAQIDELQTKAAYQYNRYVPHGAVLAVTPNDTVTGIIMTVDTLNDNDRKSLNKILGSTVQFIKG